MGTNVGKEAFRPFLFFFSLSYLECKGGHALGSENAQNQSETCVGARLWYCWFSPPIPWVMLPLESFLTEIKVPTVFCLSHVTP